MTNTERLSGDLKNVVHDAQEILKEKTAGAAERTCAVRARLVSAIEEAKEYCETLEAKAVAGAKATDKVIRQHPYQTAAVTLGIGILVGYLLKRK